MHISATVTRLNTRYFYGMYLLQTSAITFRLQLLRQNFTNALGLLDEFYPERTISITSRDPHWVTPEIKAKLRRKNGLMKPGRVEEDGALAHRIVKEQARRNISSQ